MKPFLRLIAIVPLFSSLAAGEQDKVDLKKDPHEPIAVGWYLNDIEGSSLLTSEFFSRQVKSGWTGQECSIVLHPDTDSSKAKITPILSLPSIQNDVYTVKCIDGMIEIAAARKGNVVEFNLRGIAPNTITAPLTAPDKHILTWDHRRGAPDIAPPAEWKSSVDDFELLVNSGVELDGTTLTVLNASASKKPSGQPTNKCMVGYKREAEGRSMFTPVISFPYLEGDEYEVKFTNGIVVVTTKRSHSVVVKLHLANLSPTSITRVQSEQDGGGQPATRPESK